MKPFSENNKLGSPILKCGNSGSAIIPEGSSSVTIFPIICINTSDLGNSCIQLNFTSNIVANNFVGSLNFQLYKLCSGQFQSTTVGPQWTFSRTAGLTDISTFEFSICDCDICPNKECKYAVVMIPSGGNAGNVVITNGTLSAVAVNNSTICPMDRSPVILKCGAPNSAFFPGAPVNAITTTTTISPVKLDTSCLCNPCIRFEFASNIVVPATTANANLTFQIFKICTGEFQPIPVGPQWTFLTSVTTSDKFTFFVCDCNTCSDECCTYTVQVTATILDIEGDGGGVTINSATLSALAVENANKNC